MVFYCYFIHHCSIFRSASEELHPLKFFSKCARILPINPSPKDLVIPQRYKQFTGKDIAQDSPNAIRNIPPHRLSLTHNITSYGQQENSVRVFWPSSIKKVDPNNPVYRKKTENKIPDQILEISDNIPTTDPSSGTKTSMVSLHYNEYYYKSRGLLMIPNAYI